MRSALVLVAVCIGVFMLLSLWNRHEHAAIARPRGAVQIHSHNDYSHNRPLVEALDAGAQSIEADINLVDGKLLIAHKAEETIPDRTLQGMYLDPLRKLIGVNHGSVYGDGATLVLLLDFKTEPDVTYPVLRKLLENYSDLLTH